MDWWLYGGSFTQLYLTSPTFPAPSTLSCTFILHPLQPHSLPPFAAAYWRYVDVSRSMLFCTVLQCNRKITLSCNCCSRSPECHWQRILKIMGSLTTLVLKRWHPGISSCWSDGAVFHSHLPQKSYSGEAKALKNILTTYWTIAKDLIIF